jgi:hypothetical protein
MSFYMQGRGGKVIHIEDPPTEKQLNYLEILEYKGPPPQNKLQASQVIQVMRERTWRSHATTVRSTEV